MGKGGPPRTTRRKTGITRGRAPPRAAPAPAEPGCWGGEASRASDWTAPAEKVFDPAMGLYGRWFAGAVVNTCYNALDRHVAGGRAEQVAGIHDSPLAARRA